MKVIINLLLCFFCILSQSTNAQYTITGTFPALAGQQVRLVGFEGMDIYTIDSTIVSEQGVFALNYTADDPGMGYLTSAENKAFFIVLSGEDIKLRGASLSAPESIVCLSGTENQRFIQYAVEHPKREQAMSAWTYLQKIYLADSLFAVLPRKVPLPMKCDGSNKKIRIFWTI